MNCIESNKWIELTSATQIWTPSATKAKLLARHVKRTRCVHKENAVAMYILLHSAWEKSESDDIDTWIKTMRLPRAQFSYWYTVLKLEYILLLFVKTIREANLPMFINPNVIPWMFALDHLNHSCWLPIYLKSRKELHLIHSTVFEEFQKRFFYSE